MIDYFYRGSCTFDSNDLAEMLELCQEYLLPDLKQLLEQIIIANVDLDNFGNSI
jgi:hypothetical protein